MMPAADGTPGSSSNESPDLGLLFHRLNNQLGIILANAELLEAKLKDEVSRARATQIVSGVLEALATAREIRIKTRSSYCQAPHRLWPPQRSPSQPLSSSQKFD